MKRAPMCAEACLMRRRSLEWGSRPRAAKLPTDKRAAIVGTRKVRVLTSANGGHTK